MDAIILVGGQGTRLRPLTARRHKSLLPLGQRRAFDHLLDWVGANGLDRAVLALGQHNEDLAQAYGSLRHAGLPLLLVEEPEPLQSGGAIRFAVRQAAVQERFVVLNGDAFLEFPLAEMLAGHEARGAELSIALHEEKEVSQFGVAEIDAQGIITRFAEKSPDPPSHLVNAGAWIFEPHLVDEIPGRVRVEDTLFPGLVGAGRQVYGHRFEGLWADIGTPARYHALVMELLARGTNGLHPGLSLGRGASIEGSQVGPECMIEPDAQIVSSILWEGVRVGAGARVEASILADSVVIGAGARLLGCIAGPAASVAPGATVPSGTVLDADTTFGGNND